MTDISSSVESSNEEDIVTIALTNEEPLLPPHPMCLMAKGKQRYVRRIVIVIVMMSLILMNLLTSSMSIRPSSRGARSSFLRALMLS